jgi:hypothetical protein
LPEGKERFSPDGLAVRHQPGDEAERGIRSSVRFIKTAGILPFFYICSSNTERSFNVCRNVFGNILWHEPDTLVGHSFLGLLTAIAHF